MHILQMNRYSSVMCVRCCSWLRAQNSLFLLKRQKYNKFVFGCQFDSLAFAPITGSYDYKMSY